MPQSLTNLVVHAVFSTKDRRPYFAPEFRTDVFSYLAASLREKGCPPVIVGGHVDHIHALFRLSRTIEIAGLVGDVKSSSSNWLKTKSPSLQAFAWQSGYAGFSVSQSDVTAVKAYIEGQEDHHRKWSFQDELRRILRENEVEYDERSLWD